MSAPTCPYFGVCNAPICPEDAESMQKGAWFADEENCRRKSYAKLPWVRHQRKIRKATSGAFERGCFTVKMLSHPCMIRAGIRGLRVDTDPMTEETISRWIAARHGLVKRMPRESRFRPTKGAENRIVERASAEAVSEQVSTV
jgi:hypothetical protein